ALLKRDAEGQFISVQPFDPSYLPETKYGGETVDPNAHLVPYTISEATLEGENISEFKQRQIDQQYVEQNRYDDNQLKPVEGP
ncbi:monovalent cation/H+ antiporter subunit D, partial [Yersinia pestis]